jgi:hypothetical protein
VTGNFQVTVTALTRPTATDLWAKASLMVRESVEPGARHAHLGTSGGYGLYLQWRPLTNDYTDALDPLLSHSALKLPILLRLVRTGTTITAQYSNDQGRTFRAAGGPLTFDPPLANTVYVGLAVTSHQANQISEAQFRGLQIRQR